MVGFRLFLGLRPPVVSSSPLFSWVYSQSTATSTGFHGGLLSLFGPLFFDLLYGLHRLFGFSKNREPDFVSTITVAKSINAI
jgi:hypothetical protein